MKNRARWLVLIALAGVAIGVLRGQWNLALLSFSTFLWVMADWGRFQFHVRLLRSRMRAERTVNGRPDVSGTLWAGRKAQVRVCVQSGASIGPILLIRDVVPEILGLQSKTQDADWGAGQVPKGKAGQMKGKVGRLGAYLRGLPVRIERALLAFATSKWTVPKPDNEWLSESSCKQVEFSYAVTPYAAGGATFPGIRFRLQDRFGLFQHDWFLPLQQNFRILPDFFQSGEIRPNVKRYNSLPTHGIHRLQRSGVGSELLELREYVVGDPPKSIAWKASARRAKLMTRQYESEVPVRIQFFLDGFIPARIGGFGMRLLDQMNFVAASLAKAASQVGDPVSATLLDESGATRLSWCTGELGFLNLLKALSEFSQRSPPLLKQLTPYLLRSALAIGRECYPELLDRRYQRTPFRIFRSVRDRDRMVGILAEVFQLSPREQAECCVDDAQLAIFLRRFLFESGAPWMAPLLPQAMLDGSEETADRELQCVSLLCESLTRSIARARDNEVFVVFADPRNCATHLDPLLSTIKLALAKHHRVSFVCPSTTFLRPDLQPIRPNSDELMDLLRTAEQARMRDLLDGMKRKLIRLGVPVAFSGQQHAIRMVLAEMDLARDGKRMQRVQL